LEMNSLSEFRVASGSGFGVTLETNVTIDRNENSFCKLDINTGWTTSSEVGSVISSPDEELVFYLMNNQDDTDKLEEFAFNQSKISIGCSNPSSSIDNTRIPSHTIKHIDANILYSSQHEHTNHVEMSEEKTCLNKKRRYTRHKKGPKQLSRHEVQDEKQWKNAERCRDYRFKKSSTVAGTIIKLEALELENRKLKTEEDERNERVLRMKDIYFKLIHSGQIKFN